MSPDIATISIMNDAEKRRRFAYNLRRLREAHDLTMQEFAQRIGVAYSTQRSLEIGRRKPGPDLLERIAEELGVLMDDLYRDGDIDRLAEEIVQRRAAVLLYGEESASRIIENLQIFTSLMRDVDRLHLPESVKQLMRDDIERAKRQSQRDLSGA